MSEAVFVLSLDPCPRCGGAHSGVTFLPLVPPFSRKGVVTHTHWSVCPAKAEPVLIVCAEDDVPAPPDVAASASTWTQRIVELAQSGRLSADEARVLLDHRDGRCCATQDRRKRVMRGGAPKRRSTRVKP